MCISVCSKDLTLGNKNIADYVPSGHISSTYHTVNTIKRLQKNYRVRSKSQKLAKVL